MRHVVWAVSLLLLGNVNCRDLATYEPAPRRQGDSASAQQDAHGATADGRADDAARDAQPFDGARADLQPDDGHVADLDVGPSGDGVTPCSHCLPPNVCQKLTCPAGLCSYEPIPGNCRYGVCVSGRCCETCVVNVLGNDVCHPTGILPTGCGVSGQVCQSCVDGDQCTLDQCVDGRCANPPAYLAVCLDGLTAGRCDQVGVCCSGCIDPVSGRCAAGNDVTACGIGGADCLDCDDRDDCTVDGCSALGTCTNSAAAALGNACTTSTNQDGKCDAYGDCCAGCISAAGTAADQCVDGNTNMACGKDGNDCQRCDGRTSCQGGACQ